jgi:multidrug efflux pump subunit AcrA (membrane-fusion protein)
MMMRRSLLRWAVPVVLLAVGLGVWLLLGGRPAMVQTAAVERGPAAELVYATGYVEAEHPVSVSTRVTAPVREVLVQRGRQGYTRGQALTGAG